MKHAEMTNDVGQLKDIAEVLQKRIIAERAHTATLESELKAVQEKIQRLSK